MRLIDADSYCKCLCGCKGMCNNKQRSVCSIAKMPTVLRIEHLLFGIEQLKNDATTSREIELLNKCKELIVSEQD